MHQVRLVALRQHYRELPVYVDDEITVRLLESDVFSDDRCGAWTVRLSRDVLERRFLELGDRGQAYVILAFTPR